KWVSYIVTSRPTVAAPTSIPRTPTSDSEGQLVDNGDGSYKYTFYRDITKAKDVLDAATYTGNNKKADLGDVSYQPTLTHRVGIQIGGNARGTSTNTADGVNSGLPAVTIKDPVNLIYDFIPATGKAVTVTDASREIVSVDKCNQCHTKLRLHGNRVETKFCMTCHTDQIKYGTVEATKTATGYSGSTNRINDFAVANFPNMVHKIHMGDELHMTGYNFANVLFNEVLYPQPRTNCVKCHTNSTATPQGDNWKNVPSRLACGACHDGINFATGQGTTLAGETHGHVGGAKADDKQCAICHDATNIPTYHVTLDPSPSAANSRAYYLGQAIPISSQLNMPAGVYKINFEIKEVTVTGAAGAKKANVVYRVLKDGTPVTFNSTGFLMNNVDGTPEILVAYAAPQDGITTPVDWNGRIESTIKGIRDKVNGYSQTGPDASGYYTATMAPTIPDNATLVTGMIGINYGGFVQLDNPAYPKGILLREPAFVIKTATGFSARRPIVSNAKCNGCHGQLGVSPTFHGGARNNGEGCAACHIPSMATGHIGSANNFGGGWSVQIKNLVHGIHGSKKRENAFTYEASATNLTGFQDVTYPAILNNCEQCHVAGSYDFSATVNAAAQPNLLWTTDARGDMTNAANAPAIGLSPWVPTPPANYTTDNLVTSPISASCFGCHDSKAAVAHMKGNNGTIVSLASTVGNGAARPNTNVAAVAGLTAAPAAGTFAFTKTEACMVCHGSGKVADIKSVHMTF
ncbi:MAG: OmcA/MtrC family decaheme c-type cytochrome, partial [Proteobacteria bacterium]|nr:OmcA/MtrC family decaheme c-type cytochrome [Pseudomonadota bacterium]